MWGYITSSSTFTITESLEDTMALKELEDQPCSAIHHRETAQELREYLSILIEIEMRER